MALEVLRELAPESLKPEWLNKVFTDHVTLKNISEMLGISCAEAAGNDGFVDTVTTTKAS
jgi:hypothetical protein